MKTIKKTKNKDWNFYAKTRQHYSNLEITNAAKTLLSMKKKKSPKRKSRRSKKRSPKRKSRRSKKRSRAV